MQKDNGLQEVVDPGADLFRGEPVQKLLQRFDALRHQVDATVLNRAGQEAQQARVPQGLQVLRQDASFIAFKTISFHFRRFF